MRDRARHRNKNLPGDPKLDMAAMVDMVFLLLIFFVMTITPEEVLAHFDVSQANTMSTSHSVPRLRVDVVQNGYLINNKLHDLDRIDQVLRHTAKSSTRGTIVICCEDESLHSQLIKILDICEKNGFKDLALTHPRN